MYLIFGSGATLAVAIIYCLWHIWFMAHLQRERHLRRRVAYLLWVLADQRT